MRPLLFTDTETTGLDPNVHEMLEIAGILDDADCIRDCAGKVVRGTRCYESKIQPRRIETAHPKALEINGYTPEKWADARPLKDVLSEFIVMADHAILVGHNIRFDAAFISVALKEMGFEERIDYHLVDTVTLAYEHLVPLGLKSLSLGAVCEFIGVKPGDHTAMADTEACREVYYRLVRAGSLKRLWWRVRNWVRR